MYILSEWLDPKLWGKYATNQVLTCEGSMTDVLTIEPDDNNASKQQKKDSRTMPHIQFSDRDLLRGKVVEPAWYLVTIQNVGEAPSKDGGSTNYPVEGTIIKNADSGSEDYAGVPLDWNFNSKAIGFAVGFLAAFGVDVKAGQRFELNNAIGKNIELFVENGEWQGRMVNRVNHKYRAVRG